MESLVEVANRVKELFPGKVRSENDVKLRANSVSRHGDVYVGDDYWRSEWVVWLSVDDTQPDEIVNALATAFGQPTDVIRKHTDELVRRWCLPSQSVVIRHDGHMVFLFQRYEKVVSKVLAG